MRLQQQFPLVHATPNRLRMSSANFMVRTACQCRANRSAQSFRETQPFTVSAYCSTREVALRRAIDACPIARRPCQWNSRNVCQVVQLRISCSAVYQPARSLWCFLHNNAMREFHRRRRTHDAAHTLAVMMDSAAARSQANSRKRSTAATSSWLCATRLKQSPVPCWPTQQRREIRHGSAREK